MAVSQARQTLCSWDLTETERPSGSASWREALDQPTARITWSPGQWWRAETKAPAVPDKRAQADPYRTAQAGVHQALVDHNLDPAEMAQPALLFLTGDGAADGPR